MHGKTLGGLPVPALALVFGLSVPAAGADELKLTGLLSGRGVFVDGPASWLDKGFGRFPEPGQDETGRREFARAGTGEIQARLEWSPSPVWDVRVHGLARYESSTSRGARGGVAEAFVEWHPELTPRDALRLRLGTFFPATSFENTRPLWASPFTMTLSALDTWIAEELRPTALEATLVRKGSRDHEIEAGAAVLMGADTSGSLLAWRGWTLGDRLTTIGERLPLPPLASFEPGGGFARQRVETTPTAELDGRPGWMARLRWSRGPGARVQVWAFDNEGDRRLHDGQYSWRTQLVAAGASLSAGPRFTLIADAMIGRSGMGPADEPHVDIDFRTAYVLASIGGARARLSGRYDVFRNVDRDHTAEPDDDDGHAWTAALLWSPVPRLRIGVEAARVKVSRPSAAPAGNDARRLQAEMRLSF
jgi:hypothetical protein